jgi:hypothetical protein
MSKDFDPFEAELAALKPEQPSPRLQQRIADQLQDRSKATISRWLLFAAQIRAHRTARLAIAAGVAACALAAFVLRHSDRPVVVESTTDVVEPRIATAFDDALPSVWTYQRALLRSPGDLEALLDRHASHASPTEPTPTHFFIRSDRSLLLEGEL